MQSINDNYFYGYHTAKLKTFYETVDYVLRNTPFTAMQIYLSNSRSFNPAKEDQADIIKTRKLLKMYNIKLFAHGNLLYNLCGAPMHRSDPNFNSNTKRVSENLVLELDIIAALGGEGVVVHPNSCHDIYKGLHTASKTIEFILKKNTVTSFTFSRLLGIPQSQFIKSRRIILENSAHEGGKRGWNLNELSRIIRGVSEDVRSQIYVCIDTAHAYGAGIYDFGNTNHISKFYEDFEKEIGLDRLKLFHINDSRKSEKKAHNAYFGSCKDRHSLLGDGYIFESKEESLSEFFKQALTRGISLIGEPPTPNGNMMEINEYYFVNSLLSKNDIFLVY